jgi:hypothetical protein
MQDLVFHGQFNRICELETVGAEELDAIVLPGIVRSGENDAGLESMRSGEEGDRRGRHNTGAFNVRSRLAQAGGKSGGDPGAGLARVASENYSGFACRFVQGVAKSQANGEDGGWVEGIFTRAGANTVCAEELAYCR